MNPGTLFPLGQVFQASQHRQASRLHTPVPRHPVRTPSRHDPTLARSASTRRSNREEGETDQSATPVAVEIQNLLLEARLSRARTTIVDSTNLETRVRADLLARAHQWRRPCVAILFDVPLDVVEARNAGRERVVRPHVVRKLHQLLPTAELLRAEGFAAVHLVSSLTASAGGSR
ncbi:AAA family ATPase [Streptomyces sp. NPDC012486]|uniref:AAA family ATPase n=1 Tax=Streptomyces sp. NPDC012486 TaxID=3156669 RepID=UPI0034069185